MRRLASLTLLGLASVMRVLSACSSDEDKPDSKSVDDAGLDSGPAFAFGDGNALMADAHKDGSLGQSTVAGAECASPVDSTCDIAKCQPNELCFSQIACEAPGDETSGCRLLPTNPNADGDDRCHQTCFSDSDCPTGSKCITREFFACSDFSGGPDGRRICF